jgi:hypothetical protein
MISSLKSPLRLLAASLLVGGLLFASIASAFQTKINITVDPQGSPAMDNQPNEKLSFSPDETIQRIKEILETRDGGYPPELHDLYLNGTKLEDNKTLKESGIKEGDTLVLKEKG